MEEKELKDAEKAASDAKQSQEDADAKAKSGKAEKEVANLSDEAGSDGKSGESAQEETAQEEEARIAAALAALPKDASAEDKANAVGERPVLLDAAKADKADDLKRIKGIGKVLEGKLNDLGVYHFDQIANWSRDQVNWVTTFLSFKGRIEREEWIPQARGLIDADAAQLNIDDVVEKADSESQSKSEPKSKSDKSAEETPVKAAKDAAPAKAEKDASNLKDEASDAKADAQADPADAEEDDEASITAALAALPKGASNEEKANVAGARPAKLDSPRGGKADDLKRIKGVGKVIEGKLNNLGIYHFDQIANWSRKEINWVTTFLSFKGRIEREDWIAQAKLLAAGEDTEFSKRVDKGDVDSSKS